MGGVDRASRMSGIGGFGEFELIARLTADLRGGPGVLVGAGDDCAILEIGGRPMCVSCDAALEGVHFRRGLAPPRGIGWKSAAAALSDIAAMGGVARYVLVTLGLPPALPLADVDALYAGIRDCVAAAGAAIVGGDVTRSPQDLVLDFTVIGELAGERFLLRSGALEGDVLAVTGWPGRSAAGLAALIAGVDAPVLAEAHLHPMPRLAEGRWLAEHAEVHAMIDLSDGLVQDAGHIGAQSGLGVDVLGLPRDSPVAALAERLNADATEWTLRGGEDYELIMAVDVAAFAEIAEEFQVEFGLPLRAAGRFTAAWEGVRLDGAPVRGGFDHFRGDEGKS